jgi:hypothetical protein
VIYVILGLLAVLMLIWYGAGVRKNFAGPPIGNLSKERPEKIVGLEAQLEENVE